MKLFNYICIITVLFFAYSCSEDNTEIEDYDPFTLPEMNDQSLKDTVGIHSFVGQKYLVATDKEQRLLYYAKEAGMFSFEAIALPESDNSSKDLLPDYIQQVIFEADLGNGFFGFPTAVEVNGKTLVIAERRESEKFINRKSDGFFLSKNDDGLWEQTDFSKYAPYGNEFMNSTPMACKTPDGKIIVKGKGLLISNGDFDSWDHYPHAFDNILDSTYYSCGASFTYSSKFGVFFGTGQYVDKLTSVKSALISVDIENGTTREVLKNWAPQILKSDGISYKDIPLLSEPVFYSVETPELSGNIGDIIGFATSKDKVYQFIYHYKNGDTFDSIKFEVALTTITGSFNRHSPVGVIFNPVTSKFEMIHSSPYYLELYSISASDLLNNTLNKYDKAEWKKEALLLDRNVSVRGQGMYPISSIVDEDAGTQKIYIFAGDEYPGRAGMFEITRTLNTDELSVFVENRRKIISEQVY